MSTKIVWFAQIVARNVVSLGDVLLLGWDARNVLLLYFVDTVLMMAVIFAGLAGAFLPNGALARRKQFTHGAGLVIPVTIAIVAVTLPFVLGNRFEWRSVIDEPALRISILWQAIAALWSCLDLVRALRESTPEELKLERRFGLVLSRWLTTVLVAVVIPTDWFGPHVSTILVARYLLQSIWLEVAPQHFAAGMPGDLEMKPPLRESAKAHGRRRGRHH